MKSTIAAVAGLALIGLVQLPLAAPAAAATCGPYPVPCAPSSSEQIQDVFALLRQALFGGSSTP
ncbi:hypothetical protein ACFVAV_03950 [Nocardia sp. NPDC057663]|uniref:hypothetical protein n=1 Tax=Nocardia sp. NPDC057663 TaxID=3346201 RepID=UPI003672B68C